MLKLKLQTDPTKRCATCARASYRPDGMISCGASVDRDALLGGAGVNPIWAERKYNPGRILGLASALSRAQQGLPPDQQSDAEVAREPEGGNAEYMLPSDGATCQAWQAHPDLTGDDERWHGCTMIGSTYEEQFSETGKRRHRPLRLGFERQPFGAELGVGDWRPGAAPA